MTTPHETYWLCEGVFLTCELVLGAILNFKYHADNATKH